MLKKLVDKLKESIPELLAVYRFGSWGTALARPESDIDLAVLTSRPLDPVLCWRVAQELAREACRDVDLVDMLQATTVTRAQIVATGERLYCSEPKVCERFEDLCFSSYARLNEERREILQDIQARGSIHG